MFSTNSAWAWCFIESRAAECVTPPSQHGNDEAWNVNVKTKSSASTVKWDWETWSAESQGALKISRKKDQATSKIASNYNTKLMQDMLNKPNIF